VHREPGGIDDERGAGPQRGYALALGYGSLYNHSHQPSARYEMDYDVDEIHVVARRRIKRGEEITISYNGDATDQAPVWFEED